jgi:hypothetical protein
MDTGCVRTTRAERQRHLAIVTFVSIAAVVLTLVLAACGVAGGTTESAAGDQAARLRRAPHTHSDGPAHAPGPSRAQRLREQHALDVERLRTAAAYTTTTTRPAVSPQFGPPPPNSGAGRRLVYCNSCQTAWIIDETGYVIWKFPVSGRRGIPRAGTYHVFRKLEMGRSLHHPDLRLPYFVGFAWGTTTDIGFHGIPLRPDNSQIEADSQLGQPLSSGCVRVSQVMAEAIYDFAEVGTTVVVLP